MPETTRQFRCGVCESHQLEQIIDLPQLPLTGIYVKSHQNDADFAPLDQGLMRCNQCGHVQLREKVALEYLYEQTYSHRGSTSALARLGNDFFVSFLRRIVGGRKFQRIIDVGCGDLYVLRQLTDVGQVLLGVDPIWKGKDHITPENIIVSGGYMHETKVLNQLGGRPDLVVATHALEHINNPLDEMRRMVDAAADEALFVFEVPAFESLLRRCRFDQVFHQHVNYFSLASFMSLIDGLDCTFITHAFDYRLWGGTLIVVFQKGGPKHSPSNRPQPPAAEEVRASLALFKKQLNACSLAMAHLDTPVYGYGAAQILPILAYHWQSDLSFLEGVLDDNPDRDGCSYPHLQLVISLPSPKIKYGDAAAIVTALDSSRDVMLRTRQLGFRHIITPLNIF